MVIADNLKKQILEAVKTAYPDVTLKPEDILLEHPGAEEHGDYSTNLALKLGKQVSLKPFEVARAIANLIPGAEVAGPGFINFKLDTAALIDQLQNVLEKKEAFGQAAISGKKIAIEFVSPNINKPLHIGHLRNGALGMSLANLYKTAGWEVVKDEINNDRGLHIMKAILGYLVLGRKSKEVKPEEINWKDLLNEWVKNPDGWDGPGKTKPDQFVGHFYVEGEKLLTEYKEPMEKQLAEMLQAWEAEDKDVWKLWKVMGDWVHEGINQTYARIGVEHDKKWYEYLLYKEGRDVIFEGLENGVFEKLPDGAIQANLEKHGLPNKVLIRHDGTAIYMTFDIALTKHKVAEFKADKYVWVVGNEQVDHFKRLFVIFEMLGLGSVEKFYHLAYGMVRVPGGKMSSRLGNVILADDLLDRMKEMAKKLMDEREIGKDVSAEEKEEIAEAVGVGAVKYTMLKVNPMLDVVFDLDKSVSLEGDSGPYIQYTYARSRSVLRKAGGTEAKFEAKNLTTEELAILRYLYRFPEVVETAARTYGPNLVATYLFELAKRFNNFYNNVPILQAENPEQVSFRLALTQACSIVLKNGLGLLGIKALEKM